MKIRLQEIELGTEDPFNSKVFYENILGLETAVSNAKLNVFKPGITGVDFNTSCHLLKNTKVVSFLTDDLEAIVDRLNKVGIQFEGPKPSHLGMTRIEFKDPDGYSIRANQAGETSPDWLES